MQEVICLSDKQDTIMVVDDAPANLKLLQGMLQAKGYLVLTFPRGKMALRAAAKNHPDPTKKPTND